MIKADDQRGFTLIELLIVAALGSLIAMAMYGVMMTGQTQFQSSRVKMELQDTSREGLYKMSQEIRQSAPSRITITGGGTGIQFNVPNPAAPIDNTTFAVNWNGGHTINYSLGGLNNSQIVRSNITTGDATVIANDVTGITFTGNSASPTVVAFTLTPARHS